MARPAGTSVTAAIHRGTVWWVALDPARSSEIRKTRPAAVISADGLNRARRTVVVVPLSTAPQARRSWCQRLRPAIVRLR
jgi:mRNA interferase MazF